MSEPRSFSQRQRRALYLAADGHCENCGDELEEGWHADHVIPHSMGGGTTIENGQALCSNCNLIKSDNINNMRFKSDVFGPPPHSTPLDWDERDNFRNTKDRGTDDESYALRRLKRDHPDLAKKVLDGQMSANAAAIEAGFRDKTATIPIHKGGEEQHERAAKSLAKHFDDVDSLIKHLRTHAD